MSDSGSQSVFKDVSSRVNSDELEQNVLDFWEREKVFEKSLEQNKDKPLFTFYDGPPYATGKPHYGHVLQSSIKDAVLRYKTMRGYYVPRRVGWDTHGLPVEVFVEKELGLKTKKDVEEYGIENFNKKCREIVFRYIDLWVGTLKRLGRWADYENGYATLDRDYMESEWWVFKQLWDQNLVYRDFRSTPYCIRCGTPLSNYETSEGYKDRWDLAVYVRLKVVNVKQDTPLSLLIWTTTPWTLPANVAVAISKDLEYVSVVHEGEELVVARDLVESIFGEEAEVKKTWSTDELRKLTYEPMFDLPADSNVDASTLYGVVFGDHVTAEDGTGLVHMAPAFGAEDQIVAKQNDLPILRTVGVDGHFNEDVPKWSGMNLFDSNEKITDDLEERGLLFKKDRYQHSYPHCWRCDEPLIYYALDTWFVKVTDIKDRMIKANQDISWIPEHIKEGRFGKGLAMAPDWAVSRNRFWSVPMPIWECDSCEARVCVGSVEELQKLSGASDDKVEDIHRPYVDDISWSCSACDGAMQRIPEVLDVWFDSGSMPYSQWHYPFENESFVEEGFPADFIAESIEMTRAWFYFLHVLSVAVKDKPAFKNVIGSGIIFGSDGNKLSKKLKNYPEINPTVEKYGADTVRMFFLSSTFGEPYVFSEKELTQVHRNLTMTLWNVYSFFVRYANTTEFDRSTKIDPDKQTVLDQWILARLSELEQHVISHADGFRLDAAARAFLPFIDDLSNWYVRRNRDRFHVRSADPQAFATLYAVLVKVSKLLSPFMPFVTEEMYTNLTGNTSVHLESLEDAPGVTDEQQAVLDEMEYVRTIVNEALRIRAENKVKVRQPLATLTVAGRSLNDEMVEIIQDEVNVKEVAFAEGSNEAKEVQVDLDLELTDELKAEGAARELTRHGQVLRRKAKYALDDRIRVHVLTDDETVRDQLSSYSQMIQDTLQADELLFEKGTSSDEEAEVSINGVVVSVGVVKV